MKEISVSECPFLKGLMIEMTAYCSDCGSKRKESITMICLKSQKVDLRSLRMKLGFFIALNVEHIQ